MILETMIESVKNRTHSSRTTVIIAELVSAQDWCWNRLITNNANILKVDDTEKTLAAQTSSYDLATNVSTTVTLVAVKWLGVKFSGDTTFHPVIFIDSSDDRFIAADQSTAATGPPVYAAMENFNQVRFAPPLPSGTILRVDYIYAPADYDLETNCSPDLPALTHQATVDKATAQMFVNQDDDRAGYWEGQALAKIYSAANSLNRRQYQQQPRIRPFRSSRPFVWR